MKPKVVVTGSTAIDQTGFYDGSFDTYQRDYQVKAMNASVTLSGVRTSFGGCAPNICYGLNMLGVDALPLSSAGLDFRDRYEAHLNSLGIRTDYITVDETVARSATCLMLNDGEGNQVIGFYPGPRDPLRTLPEDIDCIGSVALAILGPEVPELTLRQGQSFARLGIPVVVDPGQVIPEFSADEIRSLLELADFLIVNEHEFTVLKTNGGLDSADVLNAVPEVVVTHGANGVDVYRGSKHIHVDAVPDVDIVEVTGCGDAFRAGYAWGILEDMPMTERAQVGCVMAMKNLQEEATQKYTISPDEIESLIKRYYG